MRMISDQDTPHRFSVSRWRAFGRNKPFLNTSNPVASRVVGGWQISGIFGYQVGFPLAWGKGTLCHRFAGTRNLSGGSGHLFRFLRESGGDAVQSRKALARHRQDGCRRQQSQGRERECDPPAGGDLRSRRGGEDIECRPLLHGQGRGRFGKSIHGRKHFFGQNIVRLLPVEIRGIGQSRAHRH